MEGPALLSQVSQPAQTASDRLVSLDVYRGITVAGMILVTDPGTYGAVYRPLLHAEWNGATPTDMIFPSFLVMIGISMTFSFACRIERGADRGRLALHVLRRSVLLFFLGLLVNGFPDYNLHTIRIPGVLQRIALCYLFASLLYLVLSGRGEEAADARSLRRSRGIAAVAVILLAGYWALLKLVPVPGFGAGRLDTMGNLGAYIDRSIFGVRHLWVWGLTPGYGVTFDPEGLLSTLPALGTTLMGVLAGEWMHTSHSPRRKAAVLAAAGLALLLLGLALNPWMPINKKIWTSSFALLSGGVGLLAFSFFYWILDILRWRAWATPALVFGTNAILAFVLSGVITTLSDRIHVFSGGDRLTLHTWAYSYLFLTWLRPIHASLAYAISIVLLNLAILYPLYRKRIFLKL
jgi:predicted acyltransferase